MANEYRDIGALIRPLSASTPTYPKISVNSTHPGQVYLATHEGESRLPFMYRSFISFTYGGKHIEDFNLIATIEGDRLNTNGYSTFNDLVSTYDILDGQYYWGTHYEGHRFSFTLATDGMDQKTLDSFLYWFRAGEAKELILSEHPNRAILARVSEPPRLQLLPFEGTIQMTISSDTYTTSTTLYKGEIELTLIADEPHWYAKQNLLGFQENDRYVDEWINANGVRENILASKDALKVLYEDGIPLGSMIDDSMLLGNGAYANVTNTIYSLIWSEDLTETQISDGNYEGEGAEVAEDDNDFSVGRIAGAVISATGNGVERLDSFESNSSNVSYFFYSGTAPAYTEVTFTLTPTLNGNYYVAVPSNTYVPTSRGKTYNYLTVESQTQQSLLFTTPNVYTSYNCAVKIFNDLTTGDEWESVYNKIRDNVKHSAVRNWATAVATYAAAQSGYSNNGVITSTARNNRAALKQYMSYFLCDSSGELASTTVCFNSQTGAATGTFNYRVLTSTTLPSSGEDWLTYQASSFSVTRAENVGDMLYSNYLVIRERNYATENGKIVKWASTSSTTRAYSHRIITNVPNGITNLQILYKNMYL